MEMIENLYNSICLENLGFVDGEEYKIASHRVSEYLSQHFSLEIEQEIELNDLISISQYKAEEQGFKFGFAYAMRLMKECGLQ